MRSARTAVLAAVVVAAAQVWGAGPVAAAPGEATLRFTCTVASFPGQSVTARLRWTAPDSVIVGQPTPALSIEVTTTLSAMVTDGAGMLRVASVEGRVDATGVVAAPEGDTAVDVPLTVPRTEVPESGPMTIRAAGTVPRLVFHQPGPATVTIGRDFAVSVELKDASGGPAAIGHLDVSCVLDPGQNTVLSSFEIVAAAPGGRAMAPPASAVPGRSGTGAQPSATRGPSASTSVPDGSTGTGPEAPETAGAVSPTSAGVAAGGTPGWLLVGAILVVVAGACGGSWWLVRRRRA